MDEQNSPSRPFIERIRDFRSRLHDVYDSFSVAEQFIFIILSIIVIVTSLTLFGRLYSATLIEAPSKGGSLTEGVVGTPRFINPVLATSDADRDLTQLIFSGLMKATPEGTYIPDLAENYTVSDNGTIYEFMLKENLTFHDGKPLTSKDVRFTIEKIQDPFIKSLKRSAWEGIEIKTPDERTIQFILSKPYAPFIENTTIGILPAHIWQTIGAAEFAFSIYNTEPIGSGPYAFSSFKENSSRTPSEYFLKSFKNYSLGQPFIKHVTLTFFPTESDLVESFEKKDIDTMGGVNAQITKEYEQSATIYNAHLPRVFGVFFNQNQNDILLNPIVREALDITAPREKLVEDVLRGYGRIIDTPYGTHEYSTSSLSHRIERANQMLEDNGWEMNSQTGFREKQKGSETLTLSFTLSTGDKRDLKFTAEHLKEAWRQIGVDLTVNIYESGDLNQNIIRPRKYEALLFGEIIGREIDLYPFWHSSNRNDPGLNIALYANITVDDVLERLRVAFDTETKNALLQEFQTEFLNDKPAVLLYSPTFTYISQKDFKNINLGNITLPSERFLDIHTWYKETNNVWNLFIKN